MSRQIKTADPKYLQIAAAIRREINDGLLTRGDRVPSERRLMEVWGVARATATKALDELRSEGLVESHAGRAGTTVCIDVAPVDRHRGDSTPSKSGSADLPAIIDGDDLENPEVRFHEAKRTGEVRTSDEHSYILFAERREPPAEVRAALNIEPGTQAVARGRVIFSKLRPIELATSWFTGDVADQCPALLEPARIHQGTTAYVEEQLGCHAVEAEEAVSAEMASPKDAELLQLDQPAALTLRQCLIKTSKGQRIFEVYKQRRGTLYTYVLTDR